MHRFFLLILLSLVASTASAGAMKEGATLDLNSSFALQKTRIESQLGDGKTYAEISSMDRATVRAALDRIADKLNGAGGVDSLTEQQKADVFNDQERINVILTKASEDSREVCTREHKVGSHRATTVCLTVAERRRLMEQTQDTIRNRPAPTLKSGG